MSPPSSLSPSSSPPSLYDRREPHPASSNEDPRRRHPPPSEEKPPEHRYSPAASPDEPGLDEKDIQQALREKRRAIEDEVDAFRRRKEAELREFECVLRKKKRKREGGVEEKSSESGGALPGEKQERDGPTTAEPVITESSSSSELGGLGLEEGLKLLKLNENPATTLPSSTKRPDPVETSAGPAETSASPARKSRNRAEGENPDFSPPFEKELQAAGLFTPSYLPLLESRFRNYSPSAQMSDSDLQHQPPKRLSTPPNSSRHDAQDSPALPLPSSLKSSSSSSFDTPLNSRKIKSPKKVTFHFDDENSVPSRSSPPPAKVSWSFGPVDDEDFEEVDDSEDEASRGEYIENASIEETGEEDDLDESTVEQVEDVAIPEAPSRVVGGKRILADRYLGDALVTPTTLDADNRRSSGPGPVTSPSINSATRTAMAPSGLLPSPSFTSPPVASNRPDFHQDENDDEDDGGLFDLDETAPEPPQQSPPHRDVSPLMSAQVVPDFSPSSNAATIPLPASVTSAPLTFGKSPPVGRSVGRRRSSLSASFTHSPLRSINHPVPNPGPIAASLPTTGGFGAGFPLSSADNSRFRRRSITKYIPSPPPEVDESREATPPIPEEDPILSPYASSLPMAISRPAFASPPNSKSPLSPGRANDIPDEQPVSGRPSPTGLSNIVPVPATLSTADTEAGDSTELLVASSSTSPPSSRHSEVNSYRRSAPFPSASSPFGNLLSPYRTKFAAEVAEAASKEPGYSESVVGGVDGRSGLDPTPGVGSYSLLGSVLEKGEVPMSFSQRMAMEDMMETAAAEARR